TNTDTPTPSLTPSDTPLPPSDTPTPTTAAFIPPTATLLEPSPDPPTQVISYQPAMQGRQLSRTPPGRGRRGNSGGDNRNGRGSAHEGTGE
ncbi:MAG: hemagglutinin, partial [Anaerolineae bacterium]|nr:hemagglutinin [Anaerolineae bacterium]